MLKVMNLLCDPGQVPSPLRASASSSAEQAWERMTEERRHGGQSAVLPYFYMRNIHQGPPPC